MLRNYFNNLRRRIIYYFSFKSCIIFLIAFISLFSAQIVSAKLFRNSYVTFELPDRWNCHMKQTEWICDGGGHSKKEAVIILTAKELGVQDSLDQYFAYLKQPKQIVGPKGRPLKSEEKFIKKIKLAQHEWVDGLHLSSEVPNFYTRYLATTKKGVAILVTFTANKTVFTKYLPAFRRAIQSLRVIVTESLLNDPNGYNLAGAGGGQPVGGSIQSAFPLDLYSDEELPDEPTAKQRRMKKLFMLLLLSIGSIGAYLFFTREKA